MLVVNRHIRIPLTEIALTATRSAGPGGQNVNKVSSAVHLRFDIRASSLPEECKDRLLALSDRRITRRGEVVIKAQRFRDQEKNRTDALERLAALIRRAMFRPPVRRATRPTTASRRRRLADKAHRGQLKRLRSRVDGRD